jgi:hypothetical protein
MSRDYYNDGFRDGHGDDWRNGSEDRPISDGDLYDYRTGIEDGERRRRSIDDLLD